jgi:hypothetical protein
MQGEGSPCHNNPLDTTQDYYSSSDCNSVGVKNYDSMSTGVSATIATITNGYYNNIVSDLVNDEDPISTANDIANSPWGTHDAVCKCTPQACLEPVRTHDIALTEYL